MDMGVEMFVDGVDVDVLRFELERNAMYLSGMSLSATVVL